MLFSIPLDENWRLDEDDRKTQNLGGNFGPEKRKCPPPSPLRHPPHPYVPHPTSSPWKPPPSLFPNEKEPPPFSPRTHPPCSLLPKTEGKNKNPKRPPRDSYCALCSTEQSASRRGERGEKVLRQGGEEGWPAEGQKGIKDT